MKAGMKWLLILLLLPAMGCGGETAPRKVADLDYAVLEEAMIPEPLLDIIEERKTAPFKLSYSDEENLYLVVGYGTQETGGYSIRVNELYLAEENIYLNADLLGPERSEEVSPMPTYPYLVLKLAARRESVIFDT